MKKLAGSGGAARHFSGAEAGSLQGDWSRCRKTGGRKALKTSKNLNGCRSLFHAEKASRSFAPR